jgi:hypothetical protein
MINTILSRVRCRRFRALALCVSLGMSTAVASASEVIVNVDPYVNANLQTYTNGNNYPLGGTVLNSVTGVSFNVANFPQGGTGAIQASTGGPDSFDIAVNIANPDTVHTLMNSGFGSFGSTIGSIEFKATGGLDYTVDLVEGQDIRDHFNGFFNNTIGTGALGPIYVSTFSFGGDVRLDEQAFVLPAAFNSATLTDIILNGFGSGAAGEPFLAAATVVTGAVPEPTSLVMLSLGIGAATACAYGRRKRHTQ